MSKQRNVRQKKMYKNNMKFNLCWPSTGYRAYLYVWFINAMRLGEN